MKTSFKILAASVTLIILTFLGSILYSVIGEVHLDFKSLSKVLTIEVSIVVLSGMYVILEEVFKK